MQAKLSIPCPQMPVRNTGWWPWSLRQTDALLCPDCTVQLPDGSSLPFATYWPQCYVRQQSAGLWQVDPVKCVGRFPGEGYGLWISFPVEPVVRQGSLMMAQPVDSLAGRITIPDGQGGQIIGDVSAKLPLAAGRPQPPFGLWEFIVDAVVVEGIVTW